MTVTIFLRIMIEYLDQRFQQEVGKPSALALALFRALQLLPHPQYAPHVARDGRWRVGHAP